MTRRTDRLDTADLLSQVVERRMPDVVAAAGPE
jgi:hypothetical protein